MTNQITIDNLCIFLKLLYEQTKEVASPISLCQLAKDLGLPYSSVLSSVMSRKGIIEHSNARSSKRKISYKWVSATEPSRHMAEALLIACKRACDGDKQSMLTKTTRTLKLTEKILTKDNDDEYLHSSEANNMSFSKEQANNYPFRDVKPFERIQSCVNDIRNGLMSMGFSDKDALEMIKNQIK